MRPGVGCAAGAAAADWDGERMAKVAQARRAADALNTMVLILV
jgi:hypothetical protein